MKKIYGILVAIGLAGCATMKAPSPPSTTPHRGCEVTIAADHAIALNGQNIELAALGSAVTAAASAKDIPVVIRADKTVPYQVVVQVLDELTSSGFSNFSMATK